MTGVSGMFDCEGRKERENKGRREAKEIERR